MENYKQFEHLNIFDDLPINIALIKGPYEKDRVIKFLNDLNITNLAQLFEAYDKGVFNDGRKKYNKLIKATIELLRFKYLQEDIVADAMLLEPIEDTIVGVGYKDMTAKSYNDLTRLLGAEPIIVVNYFNLDGGYDFLEDEKKEPTGFAKNTPLIQLLRRVSADKKYHNLFLKSELYGKYGSEKAFERASAELNDLLQRIELLIEYYEVKKGSTLNASFKFRMKELERLQNQRKVLDKQIEMAEESLRLLDEKRGQVR